MCGVHTRNVWGSYAISRFAAVRGAPVERPARSAARRWPSRGHARSAREAGAVRNGCQVWQP
eukprot:328047-Chlamydomonas_euryale.AAC.1